MKKMYYKSRPVVANPTFQSKFDKAILDFTAAFIGSKEFNHSLTKGTEREIPLRNFFRQALPDIFAIKPGEVIDCFDNSSPQLDLMIYDKSKTIEFYSGDAVIIPAETLLVSIEVKSILNKEEAKKILINAKKLKSIRPYKKQPKVKTRDDNNQASHCRYFHCVFAYHTDFKSGNWAASEYQRFAEVARDTNTDLKNIDRIYVANKGIINPVEGLGVDENDHEVVCLMYFFNHILNFIFRENNRRKPVPYELYAGRQSKGWKSLV